MQPTTIIAYVSFQIDFRIKNKLQIHSFHSCGRISSAIHAHDLPVCCLCKSPKYKVQNPCADLVFSGGPWSNYRGPSSTSSVTHVTDADLEQIIYFFTTSYTVASTLTSNGPNSKLPQGDNKNIVTIVT